MLRQPDFTAFRLGKPPLLTLQIYKIGMNSSLLQLKLNDINFLSG